jgi:hypothetical protein
LRIQDKASIYKRLRPTPREVSAVLFARREALDTATRSLSISGDMPVAWRAGWCATVTYLDRDADGSLRARITVTGPGLLKPYVRNVRCVEQKSLNLR